MKVDFNPQNTDWIRSIDAQSRLTVWILNHINSPEIAKIGDFSICDGHMISKDGKARISLDFGLTLRQKLPSALLPMQTFSSLPCQQNYPRLFPLAPEWNGANPYNTVYIEKMDSLSPLCLPDLLSILKGSSIDFEYLSYNLHLDKVDFDKIDGPFSRCFEEGPGDDWSKIYQLTFPISDGERCVRTDVWDGGAIFTLKNYKFQNQSGVYQFLFKPDHPGFCNLPFLAGPTTLCLDPVTTWLNSGMMTLIVPAGNLSSLHWNKLPQPVQLICRELRGNATFNYREISQVLDIIAAARQQRVTITVSLVRGVHEFFTQDIIPEPIPLADLLKKAQRYGVDIPEILKMNDWQFTIDALDFTPRLPYFWPRGGITLFYGKKAETLAPPLLSYLRGSNQQDAEKIALFCSYGAIGKIRKQFTGINNLTGLDSRALKSQDELGKQLETFDLLVVVSGEKLTDTEMSSLLDACLVHRVPTALFLSDDTPSLGAVREIAAQKFYVGIPKNGQSFLIKDMATSEINRYRFTEEGQVEITKATEKEFVQECSDIHS